MKEIKSLEEFANLLKESSKRPVLLCKYSPTCEVSAAARSPIDSFFKKNKEIAYYSVDVIGSRETSRAIAEQIKIKHESPQALLFVNGKCVWHDSHFRLTEEALNTKMVPLAKN